MKDNNGTVPKGGFDYVAENRGSYYSFSGFIYKYLIFMNAHKTPLFYFLSVRGIW